MIEIYGGFCVYCFTGKTAGIYCNICQIFIGIRSVSSDDVEDILLAGDEHVRVVVSI